MKTHVYVCLDGAGFDYIFNMDIDSFKSKWANQIGGVGYFTHQDESGTWIIINPSKCGVIEITKRN
jgi:hypothetical protein